MERGDVVRVRNEGGVGPKYMYRFVTSSGGPIYLSYRLSSECGSRAIQCTRYMCHNCHKIIPNLASLHPQLGFASSPTVYQNDTNHPQLSFASSPTDIKNVAFQSTLSSESGLGAFQKVTLTIDPLQTNMG